jgi:hypothetical protein
MKENYMEEGEEPNDKFEFPHWVGSLAGTGYKELLITWPSSWKIVR